MDSEWYQQQLTPAMVVEVNVKIGVIPSEDHVQALVEIKDPQTDVLVGQWSTPHVGMRRLPEVLARCIGKASDFLDAAVGPFDS